MILVPRPFKLAAAVACAVAGPPASAAAQSPVALEHRASFPESFGFLQTVRELGDGRVIVADPLGGVLAVADLRGGGLQSIGREGAGPGEWRQPDAVYPLPGDSTLLVDLGNARLTVLDPSARPAGSEPMARPGSGEGPAALTVVQPRATDAAGRVYFQSRPRPRPGAGTLDSIAVMRWERGATTPVRVAALRPPAVSSARSGGGGEVRVQMRPVPLSPQDDWAVAPDGRVAVVRAEPYRVEWVQPDGRVVRGPEVGYRPVRVREREKERWLEEAANGLQAMMTIDNGSPTVQLRRGGGRPANAEAGDYEWPETLPAFRAGGARVAPDGRLWVERYGPAGADITYDLFDGRGARVGAVRLPAGQRVIGFGRDAVYVARVDDLGLSWLEVYAPPKG